MEQVNIQRKDCNFMVSADKRGLDIAGYVESIAKAKMIIADMYHYLWYVENVGSRKNIFWFGKRLIKNPLDLWIYQEIIHKVKPGLIIETGTYQGGSAYYLACLLDVLRNGMVITVDVKKFDARPNHPRIKYLIGSSTDGLIIELVESWLGYLRGIKPKAPILVILDSKHTPRHVSKELDIYSKYVTKNSYLIVEDTDLGGNPIVMGKNGGPMTAVKKFLEKNHDFVADREWERFRVTSCPNGFLKRIGGK